MSKLEVIKKYLEARAESDLNILLEVFTSDAEIHNVNFPVYRGVKGIKEYNESFMQRIEHAKFDLLLVLEKENMALVEWEAQLTYKEGAQVAGVVVGKPFTFSLRGVNRFDFIKDKIQCLRIYHETTTAVSLAKEHAR